MSTQTNERIPHFTRGDRLRKARTLTGLSIREFAKEIGVSHGTVTNAENDEDVRPITYKQWAVKTGVPLEWLLHGNGTDGGPSGGQEVTQPTAPLVSPVRHLRAA